MTKNQPNREYLRFRISQISDNINILVSNRAKGFSEMRELEISTHQAELEDLKKQLSDLDLDEQGIDNQ